jgi:hypothetical protein
MQGEKSQMFNELIITALPELVKFFSLLEMPFYFTPAQNRHFQAFVVAMMLRVFGGKVKDVAFAYPSHFKRSVFEF